MESARVVRLDLFQLDQGFDLMNGIIFQLDLVTPLKQLLFLILDMKQK